MKRVGEYVLLLFFLFAIHALCVLPMITMWGNPHLSVSDVYRYWYARYTFYL